MNIEWPPKNTVAFHAKKPTRKTGLVINAEPGGSPKKDNKKAKEDGR